MANHSAKGTVGETFALDVERGKVLEFARATRARHPDFHTGDHPVAPPTFLTTTLFWQELTPGANPWPAVELDPRRGLHAEQAFVFFGPPPRAGTRLFCRSRIEDVFEKQGRRGGALTFAIMVTEFRDQHGKLVAEARMTGVETSRPPGEGA